MIGSDVCNRIHTFLLNLLFLQLRIFPSQHKRPSICFPNGVLLAARLLGTSAFLEIFTYQQFEVEVINFLLHNRFFPLTDFTNTIMGRRYLFCRQKHLQKLFYSAVYRTHFETKNVVATSTKSHQVPCMCQSRYFSAEFLRNACQQNDATMFSSNLNIESGVRRTD